MEVFTPRFYHYAVIFILTSLLSNFWLRFTYNYVLCFIYFSRQTGTVLYNKIIFRDPWYNFRNIENDRHFEDVLYAQLFWRALLSQVLWQWTAFVFGHIMSYSVTFWGPWNYPGEFWLWCTSINTLLKIQVSTSIKQSTCPLSNYTIYTIKPQIVTIIIELFVGFSIYLFLFFLLNVHRR